MAIETNHLCIGEYTLRKYQEALYKKALQENVIICLPTGTGKTMIAFKVIHHRLSETQAQGPERKRSFFLAPTRALVVQQYQAAKELMPETSLSHMTGEQSPDDFDTKQWIHYLDSHQVFFMTPDILSRILIKGYLKFHQINVIVFDELHWAVKRGERRSNHAYGRIMELFYEELQMTPDMQQPRIMALSASLLNYSCSNPYFLFGRLEQIYNARIFSGDYSQYFTEAREFIFYYDENVFEVNLNFDFDEFVKLLNNYEDQEGVATFVLVLGKIQSILKFYGPWFTLELIDLYLQCSLNLTADYRETLRNILQVIRQRICLACGVNNREEEASLSLSFVANKLETLVSSIYLRNNVPVEKENTNQVEDQRMTCIVFVQERTDANLIYRWLKVISSRCEQFRFIKPGFICGSPSKDFVKFDRLYDKDEFRDMFMRNELNVMVATAVLEEGIDVPVCNTVIRYDFPDNYRSFCQSRGRARDRYSHYYIMVANREKEFAQKKLSTFVRFDQKIKNKEWRNRPKSAGQALQLLLDPDDSELRQMEVHSTGVALLRPKDSLNLLQCYIQKLPADFFTERMPNFQIVERSSSALHQYAYLFIFPINSPFAGTVVRGAFFSTKKAAKSHCAFRACKFLLKQGELDAHLNVWHDRFLVAKHLDELNIRDKERLLDFHEHKSIKMDLEQTRTYPRYDSIYFKQIGSFGRCGIEPIKHTYHLYTFDFFSNYEEVNPDMAKQFYKPQFLSTGDTSTSKSFGALFSSQFPQNNLQSFFYFNLFQIRFRMVYRGEFRFEDDAQLVLVDFFHRHTMNQIINTESGKIVPDSQKAFGFYLVPTDSNAVDFDLLNQLYYWNTRYYEMNRNRDPKPNESMKISEVVPYEPEIEFPPNQFTIFSCFHHRRMDFYFIKSIPDIYPKDPLSQRAAEKNEPTQSFNEYFKSKYKIELKNQTDPMLHSAFMRLWKANYHLLPLKARAIRNRNYRYGKMFPVELVTPYPLSTVHFLRLLAVPVMLFRLEQFCVARELMDSMSYHIPVDYEESDFKIEQIMLLKEPEEVEDEEEKMGELLKIDYDDFKLMPFEKLDSKKPAESSVEKFNRFVMDQLGDDINLLKDKGEDGDYQAQIAEVAAKAKSMSIVDRQQLVQLEQEAIGYGEISVLRFEGDIDKHIVDMFDTFHYKKCPNPWHILQALTLAKAGDLWNIERLETIGDSFLKMVTTLYVFFNYPMYDEGKLNLLKKLQLSNKNLHHIAIEKGFQHRVFECLDREQPLKFLLHLCDYCQVFTNQQLKFKDVADTVEALLGAYLVNGSAGTAVDFLRYLGYCPFNPEEFDLAKFNPDKKFATKLTVAEIDDRKSYQEIPDRDIEKFLSRFKVDHHRNYVQDVYKSQRFSNVEKEIDYSFHNKVFLIQAFTHPSIFQAETGQCFLVASYQQLEFIGDAVLDYLITYHIYHKKRTLSPSEITTLRTALVNNFFYSSIVVKYGLYKYMRYANGALDIMINNFVDKFKKKYLDQVEYFLQHGISETEATSLDEIDMPKALADVFEALAGAVYIDSGLSLNAVWRVFYRMIKLEIEHFIQKIPLMPVEYLERHYENRYSFSAVEFIDRTRKRITLKVDDKYTFVGHGTSKKHCKTSAAKQFLVYLRKQKKAKKEGGLHSNDTTTITNGTSTVVSTTLNSTTAA